jgi:hypothetical protein
VGPLLSPIPVSNKVDMGDMVVTVALEQGMRCQVHMAGTGSWGVGVGEAVVCFLILLELQEEELTMLAAL